MLMSLILTCTTLHGTIQPDGSAAGAAAQPVPATALDRALLAERAADALIAKCANCHGSQLERPKGEFALADDLKTLAATPDFVAPGKPAESLLWYVIETREMPPRSSRAGPLTDEERAAILVWIEAGAPVVNGDGGGGSGGGAQTMAPGASSGEVGATASPGASGSESPTAHPVRGSSGESSASAAGSGGRGVDKPFDPVEYAGRFHVVFVHFPIALLLCAALAELWALWRSTPGTVAVVRFCLVLGALSAVGAAVLGWFHALDVDEPLFSVQGGHRWLGTAAAALSVMIVMGNERDLRLAQRRAWVRGAILLQAALVGFVGHLGGMLTHGTGYFDL